MSLRVRIGIFLAALLADAIFVRTQPWTLVVGVLVYAAVVYPALFK